MLSAGVRPFFPLSNELAVEWTCARELARLARRSPRYLVVILPLYGRTALLPRRATLMRRTYCLARFLDDVLDGDRPWPGDPVEMATTLLSDARNRALDDSDWLRQLARSVFNGLQRLCAPDSQPAELFCELIETMLFDAERARLKRLLPRAELSVHLVRGFTSALGTALAIAGAQLRITELLPLAQAQAELYTLRDLEVDLSRGVINIPEEVVAAVRLEGPFPLAASDFLTTHAIRRWYAEVLAQGTRHTGEACSILAASRDSRARWVASPLLRGLRLLGLRLAHRSVPAPPSPGASAIQLEAS